MAVSVYVSTPFPRTKPYQVHSTELGKVVTTRFGQGGAAERGHSILHHSPPILARLGESSGEPETASADHAHHLHTVERDGRLLSVQISLA